MMNPETYFKIMPQHLDMTVRTELYYVNEFTFAVAVILSAQATDKKVNEITPALFAVADTPEAMLTLSESGLKEHIKVISFFNNKAKNILALSELLNKRTDGQKDKWTFPVKYHNRDELMKLPGIGQKTANVIMNVLWGAPTIGIDTHAFRLAHRFGWVGDSDNTPEKVEEKLLKLIPKKYHNAVNHIMVLHGRYICKAQKPLCADCPVNKFCPART
ncbi:MAG: endonuclease III [Rickettsiales bacterium]|jgi:endonuclease-3|nr:endonuclease III [Rickettsiales bacterium]